MRVRVSQVMHTLVDRRTQHIISNPNLEIVGPIADCCCCCAHMCGDKQFHL
eukprot:COSAG01_NODE_925_length_12707_cov_21.250297_7_plen_51_part_00